LSPWYDPSPAIPCSADMICAKSRDTTERNAEALVRQGANTGKGQQLFREISNLEHKTQCILRNIGGRPSAVTTERDDPNAEGHGRGLWMQFEVSAFHQHGFYLGLGHFCIPNSVRSKNYRIGPSLIDPPPLVLHHGRSRRRTSQNLAPIWLPHCPA
jgi:hypothetical protein